MFGSGVESSYMVCPVIRARSHYTYGVVMYTEDAPIKMSSVLKSKIDEFNSAFKLGIDLGTKNGGVALVKDNKIIFARTFLDYHKTDLSKRRAHRRNRRSRRAKEKRLARLRSWILRHKVNGKQLSDPYKYKVNEHDIPIYRKGEKPSQIKGEINWINVLKSGKNVSSEAFVKALITIFTKRGQSYDKYEIMGLNDKEFLKFIQERTTVSQEEYNELLDELNSRHDNGSYSDIIYEQTQDHISKITENPGEKINEKSRDTREKELEEVIKVFCSRNGIEKEGNTWVPELKHILNKRVRQARFKNRILIRCNICDKPTPSKRNLQVRELNYLDAVRNFLKAGRIDESFSLIDYYKDLYKSAKPIRDKILSNGELNENEKLDKKKIIHKILPNTYRSKNQFILSKQKNMKIQIVDLLFNKLYGRSRYCKDHLKARAEGKDIEKGRHGSIGKRHDRNVTLMNHDKRVLNLIEQLLFKEDKELAEKLNKLGIKYISIEAPEPKTKRAKKGNIIKRDSRKLKEKLFDANHGVCIYTGEILDKAKINEYQVDHIFPKSRDGPSIQDNCVITTNITNKSKGNLTPWEWLGIDNQKWDAFEARCNKFYREGKLSGRKLELLLNKSNEYPENNPTELTRVGARIGNFQQELIGLFKRYGLEEPQTLFNNGKPIIQIVRGNETQKLRRLWGTTNPDFVPLLKDRAATLNHAEDAAIAASMPPKIWREQIYRYVAKFNGGKERPDFAIPNIAPHLVEYTRNRISPLISVLGSTHYTWKTSIMDDTFYIQYNARANYDKIYKQSSKNVTTHESDNESTTSNSKPILLKNEHQLKKGKKYYHKSINGTRYFLESQLGGTLLDIKPKDGPKRCIQINPVFSEIILTDGIILRRPIQPLLDLYISGKLDLQSISNELLKKSLESYATSNQNLGPHVSIKLHDIIYLDKTETHEKGYFIITKLGKSIVMMPEERVKVYNDAYKKIPKEDTDNAEIQNTKKEKGNMNLTLSRKDIAFLINSKPPHSQT